MPDKRVIKTKNSIRTAFLYLLEDKEFSKLTIRELAETAGINRKTFYLHYSSLDDVMEELRRDILLTAGGIIEKLDFLSADFSEEKAGAVLSGALSRNRKLMRRLLDLKRYGELISGVQGSVRNAFAEYYSTTYGLDEDILRVCAEYLTRGMMGAYKAWLDEEEKMPLQELIKLMCRLTMPGIRSVLKEAAFMN
ncbi:MAG: TetR/AcrR family transcriptional regulator [Clostridiales bacterium]|nr:TetR/AcrR family transcriptional regulator [Clostridiales bacterium]